MYMCIIFFLIPWQFYKNYTTILSSHPQHTILVLVLSLSHHKGVHRGGGGGHEKMGGDWGRKQSWKKGWGSNGGRGRGGGGGLFSNTSVAGYENRHNWCFWWCVSFSHFRSYIDRNLSNFHSLFEKQVVSCLFYFCVCVCFSWFGPVFNFTTHLRIKKKKSKRRKRIPQILFWICRYIFLNRMPIWMQQHLQRPLPLAGHQGGN